MSMLGSRFFAISTIGPEMALAPVAPVHGKSYADPVGGMPPSCRRTTIASTPRLRRSRAASPADTTSSRKSTSLMPAWATSSGVPSSVMPMNPTLMPSTRVTQVGGSTVRPVRERNQSP